MIILDQPYVSDLIINTAARLGVPVLNRGEFADAGDIIGANCLSEAAFIERLRAEARPRLYCNSENSLAWVDEKLGFSRYPAMAGGLKDKARFRELLVPAYPEFKFRKVGLGDLDSVAFDELPHPCVVKPSVGFFSFGVHRVDTVEDWEKARASLKAEMNAIRGKYPESVIGTWDVLIEACVEGEEYALDVYFDEDGKPVILDILHHVFLGHGDVKDRLYYTSPDVMRQWLGPMERAMEHIGKLCGLADFPAHVEVRVDDQGRVVPIEANALRFAGFCVTDIALHAWGVNPYECYQRGLKPDWERILPAREGKVYAMVLCDLPDDIPADRVADIDYAALAARFERPLEIRRIDWTKYPVYAFVFSETRADNWAELDRMLRSDLRDLVVLKP